ncbi:Neurotransmitter-gated ion-channel ligand binding domain protein [uncultured archaeon]|nr:Neurotransmitter-gated ion-channel ligand binding domain protein [uncultured archaeon]
MRAGFNVLLLAGILISLTMLSNPGYAEVAPSKINTSIYVYNIRGFDVSTGQYDVDFYIHFKWNADDVPKNISDQVTSFDLMNGRIDSQKTISSDPGDIWLQVSGTFNKRVDLKDYPADTQTLTIELENSNLNNTQLVYVADTKESSLDKDVEVLGWVIKSFEIYTKDHIYPTFGETYTRLVYQVNIARSTSILFKTVLPAMLLLILGLFAFFIPPADLFERLGLLIAVILGSFQHHLAVSGTIPPAPYLTLIDAIMVTNYITQGFIIIVSIYLFRQEEERGIRLNKKMPFVVIAVALVIFLLIWRLL